MEAVAAFAREGGPVLGICNGFQVLCEAGLLPGALLPNEGLRFLCRQVDVEVAGADSAWTRACAPGDGSRSRSSTPPDASSPRRSCSTRLEADGQVVSATRAASNPNGSLNDVAGVRNEAGNVVGLMPHPEHAVDELTGSADGLRLFESAVRALAPA